MSLLEFQKQERNRLRQLYESVEQNHKKFENDFGKRLSMMSEPPPIPSPFDSIIKKLQTEIADKQRILDSFLTVRAFNSEASVSEFTEKLNERFARLTKGDAAAEVMKDNGGTMMRDDLYKEMKSRGHPIPEGKSLSILLSSDPRFHNVGRNKWSLQKLQEETRNYALDKARA